MKEFLKQLFSREGSISSKRVAGILLVINFIVYIYVTKPPNDNIINTTALLITGLLVSGIAEGKFKDKGNEK